MRIAGVYSFNKGEEVVTKLYPDLLPEVNAAIKSVDAAKCKTKVSTEKTMMGQMLYSPTAMNKSFKKAFGEYGWRTIRVPCTYPTNHYATGYQPRRMNPGAFREMDFVKNGLGVEVQFGKYAFMVYNVCAKMTIFNRLGHINHGIEIVPVKGFAEEMSSGVSYYEQFIWDLENRGVSNIDIPMMILGIDG